MSNALSPECSSEWTDGIDWEIRTASSGVTQVVAVGSIPDGGSYALPQMTLEVGVGDSLLLIVGPREFFNCDLVHLDLTIKTVVGD
jgi:hypothetical protein